MTLKLVQQLLLEQNSGSIRQGLATMPEVSFVGVCTG